MYLIDKRGGYLDRSDEAARSTSSRKHDVESEIRARVVSPTGAQLYTFNRCSARAVEFSVGDKLVVITTDPFIEQPSTIQVKRIARDPSDQSGNSVLTIKGPHGRINRAVWGPLNKTIISAGEDAVIRIWDSETGQLLKESDKEGGQKAVTSLAKSIDWSHFLTGSLDKSAKVVMGGRKGFFEEIGGVKKAFGPINAIGFQSLMAEASYFTRD
ncbi:hypothetical protein HPP92_011173 [Vanilla planifolia]|uniref:Serine-threonine kinase receptor-associated protein n=1 Tax=Vanilla planifolia TaxID=51239 RepID=A0A835R2B8_VANPL|nr:hypothetical protein HPP92_011173 [Vanilla planifolia]